MATPFSIPRVVGVACTGTVVVPLTRQQRQRIAAGEDMQLRADFDKRGNVGDMQLSTSKREGGRRRERRTR